MDTASSMPIDLPLAQPRPERGDAAANRQRILTAARRLVAELGADAISMDAVAAAAGVGKGTVFRRFGGRTGLIEALVNDYMRDFQNAFLSGPPPLGPGAPPADRLEAFLLALVELQYEHLQLALAAESPVIRPPSGAYLPLFLHTRALIADIRPGLDSDVLATMLLQALSPQVLYRVLHESNRDPATLNASIRVLLMGLVPPPCNQPAH